MVQDEEDISYLIRKLTEEYKKWARKYFKETEETLDLKISNDTTIKVNSLFKYMGFTIWRGITLNWQQNGILWDNHIKKHTKKIIFAIINKIIMNYCTENCVITKNTKVRL